MHCIDRSLRELLSDGLGSAEVDHFACESRSSICDRIRVTSDMAIKLASDQCRRQKLRPSRSFNQRQKAIQKTFF